MKSGSLAIISIVVLLVASAVLVSCSSSNVSGPARVQAPQAAAYPRVFMVDSLAVNPEEVNAGVDALITARVTNTAITSEKYEGQVRLDNLSEPSLPTYLACQLVNVPPGSTQIVSVAATINNPGKYRVTLDGVSQELTVNPGSPRSSGSLVTSPLNPVPAIDFTATDVVTGKKITLKDFRGKPILLNFVNYGCNPSVNDVVSAQLLSIKKIKDLRNDFVPVSVFCGCCPPDVLKQFAKDNNLNWPWILDADNSIIAKYGSYVRQFGYPTLVYINADFMISEYTGAVSQPVLNDKLGNLALNGATK